MAELSVREYEALLRVADVALHSDGSRAWLDTVAELALGELLHGDVFAVADVDQADLTGTFAVIRPSWAEVRVPSGSAMHQDLLAGHPMTGHMGGPRAGEVVRISDLVPQGTWRSMPGYSKQRELIGATFQLGITAELAPGRAFSMSTIRADRDFSEHEVGVARRLQPILRAADRHVRAVRAQRSGRPATELAVADRAASDLGLTQRQQVVLGLLSEGLTSAAAARRLGVSARTVAKHQEHIYRKLGVTDRVSAVLRAQRAGLLPTVATGPAAPAPQPTVYA